MTERDIQCFSAVAKYMNFTEAAKHLYVSQQALSKHITKLEDELGFSLFVRSKRGVTLSPGGMVIRNDINQLRSNYQSMLGKAKMANEGKTGELCIGIQEGQNMDEDILAKIQDFRRQYPQIQVDVICHPYREMLDQLRQSRIDIGLSLYFAPEDFVGLHVQKMMEMQAYVLLARNHPIAENLDDISVLNTLTLLVVGSDLVPQGEAYVLEMCERCNIFPARVRRMPSYSALYFYLSMGDGFALMNQNMWFFNKTIQFFPLPETANVTRVSCWREGSNNPAVPLFLSTI